MAANTGIFQSLIQLADKLDNLQLTKEAAFVDRHRNS